MRKTKKQILINTCYKVLCSYENYQEQRGSFHDYQMCLNRAIIALTSQQSSSTIEDSILLLKGIYNMGAKATHDDVKQIVFHVMNEIERKVEEVV